MQTFLSHGVRIAFIDVEAGGPAQGAAFAEPFLLIHGFASNHAVNWMNTLWVKTLTQAGRRVIALDNRGHGQSEKLYRPEDYATPLMAGDVVALLDHLDIEQADVMGYSMGARITAFLALANPGRVRSIVLGGLGHHLVAGAGLPMGIADAMEAPALQSLTDPMQRMFRIFAESTRGDLRALAACIRGSRQVLSEAQAKAIVCPALVAVGTKDEVAGDGPALAAMLGRGRALDIPGRDHNFAVGDKVYKQGVLDFLNAQS